MKSLLLSFLVLLSLSLSAQKMNISGVVTDTVGENLPVATVLLLDRDSVYLDFTQTDVDGKFSFSEIDQKPYLLKFSYLSYLPLIIPIDGQTAQVDLGIVKMKPIATELMEVVIREAKAPMKIRGDTIEYDPTQFQVPEGSSVEDLLKKLPGMRVDRDGTITSQGQEVKKVTVDGKDFFGGNPKEVTKNLPAEGVSKVQVFDHKTDEEKITGEDSDPNDKELNIELKEDYKTGTFGRAIAGYGTEDRYEVKGNLNRFNEKNQLGVVLLANNTNRNGLDWDDYQEFMGSSAGNRFGNNLEYGFNSGGGFFFYSGGGSDNDLETQISSMFFSNSINGYFENILGGVNYNYQDKKVKFGVSYFYNDKNNQRRTVRNTDSYFEDYTANRSSESNHDDDLKGHRVEANLEIEIDSFNTIEAIANFSKVNNDLAYLTTSESLRNMSQVVNKSSSDNRANFGGDLIKGSVIYRKTFRKKRRLFAINGTIGDTNSDEEKFNRSNLQFADENFEDGFRRDTINQHTLINAEKRSYAFNTQYNEPLSKTLTGNVFYNFDSFTQSGDQDVTENNNEVEMIDELLTRDYRNQVTNHRPGSSLRYSKDGVNVTVGLAYKIIDLNGSLTTAAGGGSSGDIDKDFSRWIPHFNFRYPLGKSGNIGFTFNRSFSAPSIRQLIPVVDNLNPLNIYEGNADLKPKDGYSYRINGYYSFPLQGVSFWFGGNFDDTQVNIVSEEIVDEDLITYRRPINYDGGSRWSMYTGGDFQIYKKILKGGLYLNYNNALNYTLVNNIENENKTRSFYIEPQLEINPTDKISMEMGWSYNKSNTEYNINTSQNQANSYSRILFDADLEVFKNFYFSGRYSHQFYKSDRFTDYDIPIIDASVYYHFLKNNQGEIRLAAYDLLNKNENVNYYTSDYSSTQYFTETLARYFMLSFRYNIRGWQSGINK